MQCPKCGTEHVIRYYPAFTEEMWSSLKDKGYDEGEIQYLEDLWQTQKSATGGFCIPCQFEWSVTVEFPQHQQYAYS